MSEELKKRMEAIIADVLANHLPRVKEGFEKGYPDENQILVIYDHAVRARLMAEQPSSDAEAFKAKVCCTEHTHESVSRLYYDTEASYLIDWVYEWCMEEFARALEVKQYERYESDGGMKDALSYEVASIVGNFKEAQSTELAALKAEVEQVKADRNRIGVEVRGPLIEEIERLKTALCLCVDAFQCIEDHDHLSIHSCCCHRDLELALTQAKEALKG
jgi:hypothetical protein